MILILISCQNSVSGWDEDEEQDEGDEEEPETDEVSEADVRWRVEIEYADEATQEIVSYRDDLFDKPNELFCTLREYFEPEIEDLDEEEVD